MFKCNAIEQKISYDLQPHYDTAYELNVEKLVAPSIPEVKQDKKTISCISIQPSGTVYVFYSDGSDETVHPDKVRSRGWIKF